MPARQNEHCVAPSSDVVPSAHNSQLLAPDCAANVPGAHLTTTLVPLHAEPAGHSRQLVLVVLLPPRVYEPAPHVPQLSALLPLYLLSTPHSSQSPFADRYVPARQNEHCVEPSSDVVPSGQDVQLDAPESAEYVPAGHAVTLLVPSHA